jgi:hypothetical protein
MIRELASRFSKVLTERRTSARKPFSLPVKVCFAPVDNKANVSGPCDESFLAGETVDLSATGIGFLVSAIRMKEKYLVGQDRPLNVELNLAGKKVRMQVMGRRYEAIGIHSSSERYLIGAEIVGMADNDRRSYEHFLENGKKLLKNYSPAFEMSME